MKLESPAQILTRGAWQLRKRRDQAGGTLKAPTTLYLGQGGTTLGPALIVEPWPDDVAKNEAAIAHAILRGDDSHRQGCASGTYRDFERESCGTCAILGWRPADSEAPEGSPNYAGWARVYVQAREPIPRAWWAAFLAELNDDENERYREALRRDVATFGWNLTEELPGYKLPTPTGAKMLAWLREYHGPDDPESVRSAVLAIIETADAEHPLETYSAADVRAANAARLLLARED